MWRSLNYSLREYVVTILGVFDKGKLEELFSKVIGVAVRLRNLL
jgi:hypothetical protein